MNISDFPPFIRWADFRGLLGVREGFRVKDFGRLVLKYTIPTFDAELRPMTLPVDPRARGEAADDWPELSPERLYGAVFDCPDTPEELHDAAFDWPDLSTEEGRQEFEGFQFDTLRVICALAAEGEPLGENVRAYLEAEDKKIQAAKEEAEQAKSEAEWLERFKAAAREGLTPEEKRERRRKPDNGVDPQKIEGEVAYVLFKTFGYPYPELAKIHNEAAGSGLEGKELDLLRRRIASSATRWAKGAGCYEPDKRNAKRNHSAHSR
jgi:hypothetical protein